ncbi:MAG: YggS family pyridoxal phosphate-dependent enzyme [Candidatus Ratteibacteria bacterium]|jgi:pyridoxal phosphate enzyme (YggS family)
MIQHNVKKILEALPKTVTLVAATKSRSVEEIEEAIEAGIAIIGENYVQEAELKFAHLTQPVIRHCIGHLQRNKAKKAIELFDLIETLDSFPLAKELSRHAVNADKIMPVLIEINSGREPQKNGVLSENLGSLLSAICELPNLSVQGLMTMGPFTEDLHSIKEAFLLTQKLFEKYKKEEIPGISMEILSMGMSNSWEIAVECGATMVRIGTALFGPRT